MKTKLFLLFVLSVFIVDGQAANDTLYIGYSKDFQVSRFVNYKTDPVYYYPKQNILFESMRENSVPADTIEYYKYLLEDSTRLKHIILGYEHTIELKSSLKSVHPRLAGYMRPNSTLKIFNYSTEEEDKRVFEDYYNIYWVLKKYYKSIDGTELYEGMLLPPPKTKYKEIVISKVELEKLNYVQLDDYITSFNYEGKTYYYLNEIELEKLFNNKPVLFFELKDLGDKAYFEEMNYYNYDYTGKPSP